MPTDTFISTSNNGKLNDKTRQRIKSTLEFWNGKKLIVTITPTEILIKKLYGTRSLPQNSLLHVILTIFTDELNESTGNDFAMLKVKEMMKLKFLKTDIIDEKSGEVIGEYIKRTRDLDKSEMALFMQKVADYALEQFNIKIPFPGDMIEMEFNTEPAK